MKSHHLKLILNKYQVLHGLLKIDEMQGINQDLPNI